VWTAGCATGEEAYTVAMLLCEHADGLDEPPGIQVFATDVHEQAFTAAREGVYAESIVADVSAERLERFFIKESGGYRVKKSIREKVLFATHNLLRDPPFLHLDLVSCRNVLIYLGRETQERVFEAFHFALNPRAFLFLGSSESPEGIHLFASFDKAHHIFQAAPHASRRAPRPSGAAVRDAGIIRGVAASPQRLPAFSLASLHQQLVEAYGPPSLVVNGDERVVHLSDRVGRFLERRGGEPTDKLFDMISGDLRLETRRLLRTALRTGKRVEARGVTAVVEGTKRRVDVTVQPLSEAGTRDARLANFALVLFDEAGAAPATRSPATATKRAKGGRGRSVEELETELRSIQARLRAADSEHDATMEALRASNEELQSITEEQRAVSEELETSKEELQSINEELRTINQEHRMRNEELAEVNSDLVNLIDSTGIGTVFLDQDLRIRRYTPALADLFNVVPTDRGRPLGDITHRLDYDSLEADARRVFVSLVTCEREVPSKDGRWFIVRITPYRSADHTIDGVVLTFVDTSDRKRIEIDREKLLVKVQEASTVKSNFIGVMSHEFRTPLNAIIGYADLLDVGVEGPLATPQRAQVARITANAHHLARMVDEILSSARLEGQVDEAKWERVDVDSLAHEIMAAVEPLARTKHLAVRVNAAAGPTPILTDGTKLRQILFNLMGNAIRFTDAGSIELRVRAAETSTVIEVEDTGIGIAPEHLNRVFERFWQADQTQTRTRGGTGLGLMVVESLTKSVGGTVEVQSELGRGSVFRVRLPRS
jgi:two-component system CheB/CheR fusion protein